MTPEEFEAAAGALFKEVAPMTLATCADNVPWASDVYFAASGFDLVFFSSLDSRHCRNLAANPACAVTVHAPVATWRDIRGLQMEGMAGLAETVGDKARALATYLEKFPFARDLMANPVGAVRTAFRAHAHVFRPTRIRYLDNRLGIGARFSIAVADGKPVWPPQREKTGIDAN
ncbi:MAG: pyridoxamine 5'-phosphate oxidase family protein [Proteobacteria bacterium]|nr:pyridoxamine 5'-phosphate oxidase family protein [Pseudomonadota bacterium]